MLWILRVGTYPNDESTISINPPRFHIPVISVDPQHFQAHIVYFDYYSVEGEQQANKTRFMEGPVCDSLEQALYALLEMTARQMRGLFNGERKE